MINANVETRLAEPSAGARILAKQKDVASSGADSSNTRKTRLRVACQRCVKAKVRCDSRRPCSRCERQHTQEQCFDRLTRAPDGIKHKHNRLRRGFRPCLPCIRRKIRCDSSRPCVPCRKRPSDNQCIDRAVVVDMNSTFQNLVLNFENPLQKMTQVPRTVNSVMKNGFRRFSPSVIQHFMESPRRNAFRAYIPMYMDGLESHSLMEQLECFAGGEETHVTDAAEDPGSRLHLISSETVFPTASTLALVSICHSRTPFGGFVVSCRMNGPAQALWGYSDDDIQSSFKKAYSDGLENKKFKNVAFIWRLFHPSFWPLMAQMFLQIWFSGDCIYDLPLYAVRKDYRMIQMRIRLHVKFGQSGMLERLVLAAIPL